MMTPPADMAALQALATEVETAHTNWASIVDAFSALMEEYYTEGVTGDRVRQIVASVDALRGLGAPYAAFVDAANAQVDAHENEEAVRAQSQAMRDAVDEAETEAETLAETIRDKINSMDGYEYVAPAALDDDIDMEVDEMTTWLAEQEGKAVAAPSKKSQKAPVFKSLLDTSLDLLLSDLPSALANGAAFRLVAELEAHRAEARMAGADRLVAKADVAMAEIEGTIGAPSGAKSLEMVLGALVGLLTGSAAAYVLGLIDDYLSAPTPESLAAAIDDIEMRLDAERNLLAIAERDGFETDRIDAAANIASMEAMIEELRRAGEDLAASKGISAPGLQRKAQQNATPPTADEALAAVDALRAGAEAIVADTDADAVRAACAAMQPAADTLAALDAGAMDDDTWDDVVAAIADLDAWLNEAVEEKALAIRIHAPDAGPSGRGPEGKRHLKAQLTRDERIKIAVSAATRGRGANRGRDAADMVLDAFYGGLGGILKGAWATLKLAGRATVALGEVVGRGVNAAAEAADAGIVHVSGYSRNGVDVAGYDRAAPS